MPRRLASVSSLVIGLAVLAATPARADTFSAEEHVVDVAAPRTIDSCDLAVRADGDVLAAWTASEVDDGNHFDPFVAVLHAGAWQVEAITPVDGISKDVGAHVSIGTQGHEVFLSKIAHRETSHPTTPYEVYARERDLGGAWTTATLVSHADGDVGLDIGVKVDGDGWVHAAWTQHTLYCGGGVYNDDVFYSRHAPGAPNAWETPRQLSQRSACRYGYGAQQPVIETVGGEILVLWYDGLTPTSGYQVDATRSADHGATWGSIEVAGQGAYAKSVAVAPDFARAHLLATVNYAETDEAAAHTIGLMSFSAGAWAPLVNSALSADRGAALGTAPEGVFVVSGVAAADGNTTTLVENRWTPAGGLEAASSPVSPNNGTKKVGMHVARDPFGVLHVLWVEYSLDAGHPTWLAHATSQVCTPSPEICGDGIDNDCNGIIDDGCDGGGAGGGGGGGADHTTSSGASSSPMAGAGGAGRPSPGGGADAVPEARDDGGCAITSDHRRDDKTPALVFAGALAAALRRSERRRGTNPKQATRTGGDST